jgi:hypothetical protein
MSNTQQLQNTVKAAFSDPNHPALNHASFDFRNGGELDLGLIERKLRSWETISTAKDDAFGSCKCFSETIIRSDLKRFDEVMHIFRSFNWVDYSDVVVKEEPLLWSDFDMSDQEDNDPRDALEPEPVQDVRLFKGGQTQKIQVLPEPEKIPEPHCCHPSFPSPPSGVPGVKRGWRTRVCTNIPKKCAPPVGKPCTFTGLCSFAHSKEEAAFYATYWSTHS